MEKDISENSIVQQLTALLTRGNAHATFEETVANLSMANIGKRPQDLPYSIWKLVEHIRITQWDILKFSRDPQHRSPEWPLGYWPADDFPENEETWNQTLEQIRKDRDDFMALLTHPKADLFTPFPHGDGQNLLREALLIADHTSYHTGQILILRRLLNDWDR